MHRGSKVFAPCERASGERGFTLLELLVAVMLVGLVVMIAFGAFRLGTRAWETGSQKTDAAAALRLQQDFIRTSLTEIDPLFVALPDGSDRLAFYGQERRVSFVGMLKSHLALGGHRRLSIIFDAEPGGGQLVLSERLMRPDDDFFVDHEDSRSHVLIDGVRRASFSYFGSDDPDEAPRWRTRWQNTTVLPRLIRLEVEFAGEDPRRWPVLTAAPIVDSRAACSFDIATRKCRNR